MKMKFFEMAKKLSYKSEHPDYQMGAVLVSRNKIIGLGFNKKKTHPRSIARYSTVHAELAAILNARTEDFNGFEMYVYGERTKTGNVVLARPCTFCQTMLKQVGITKIYYSTKDSYTSEVIS